MATEWEAEAEISVCPDGMGKMTVGRTAESLVTLNGRTPMDPMANVDFRVLQRGRPSETDPEGHQ